MNSQLSEVLSVGFVVYFPEESVFGVIEKFLQNSIGVYVYDNGMNTSCRRRMLELASLYTECELLGNGTNVGLGKSYSELLNLAKHNTKYFLMLDQDTLIADEFFPSLANLSLENAYPQMYASIQVLSELDNRYLPEFRVKDVLFNINSGALFNMQVYDAFGGHDVSYFVEGVDYDFCLRARESGYKIGVLSGVKGLDHFSNQDGSGVVFFGRLINIRVYPLSRVLDFYRAHFKLLRSSIRCRDAKSAFFLIKYMVSFMSSNVFSYLLTFLGRSN